MCVYVFFSLNESKTYNGIKSGVDDKFHMHFLYQMNSSMIAFYKKVIS